MKCLHIYKVKKISLISRLIFFFTKVYIKVCIYFTTVQNNLIGFALAQLEILPSPYRRGAAVFEAVPKTTDAVRGQSVRTNKRIK